MRIERDGTYLAVASAAGAPKHPAWYHNLIAHPRLRLQDGTKVHSLRAREVFGAEKRKPGNWPNHDGHTSRSTAPKPDEKSRSAPRGGSGRMTARDMGKSTSTSSAEHEQKASVAGWIGVVAVTLGTFTLVTNEFIPVGLLTNIAKDMHVSLGVAGTTVTVPGLVAAAAAPLITVAVGNLDRRIVLALMSIAFIVADVLASFAPNIGILLLARFALGLGIGGFWAIARVSADAWWVQPRRDAPQR